MNPLADDVLKMVWLFDRGDQRQDAVRDLAKRIDTELEAARKEISTLKYRLDMVAVVMEAQTATIERLREEVRRKDIVLREVADCDASLCSGCKWGARAALSPKSTEPDTLAEYHRRVAEGERQDAFDAQWTWDDEPKSTEGEG